MKQIIKAPLITEKNTYHNAAGVYVFEVDLKSSKTEIRSAVEKNFRHCFFPFDNCFYHELADADFCNTDQIRK